MKENKKKGGISRLLELAGEKKTLVVWCCILSTLSVFFELVPFLAVYQVLGELLKHAADLSQANAKFMLSWAGYGIIGLLIGYALMYVGGMLGHTAAYRTLYGVRERLAEHIGRLPLGWFNRNAIGKIKQITEQDVEQIEIFIAHQFPDMVNTVVLLLVMIVVMFSLNAWLALAAIVPILVGFAAQFSMMFGQKAQVGLKEYYDALENINTSSVQYVRGMPSIKIFGQTVHSFRRFYQDIIAIGTSVPAMRRILSPITAFLRCWFCRWRPLFWRWDCSYFPAIRRTWPSPSRCCFSWSLHRASPPRFSS